MVGESGVGYDLCGFWLRSNDRGWQGEAELECG